MFTLTLLHKVNDPSTVSSQSVKWKNYLLAVSEENTIATPFQPTPPTTRLAFERSSFSTQEKGLRLTWDYILARKACHSTSKSSRHNLHRHLQRVLHSESCGPEKTWKRKVSLAVQFINTKTLSKTQLFLLFSLVSVVFCRVYKIDSPVIF